MPKRDLNLFEERLKEKESAELGIPYTNAELVKEAGLGQGNDNGAPQVQDENKDQVSMVE